MAQTLRIVNYAVNGSGAGHLTRLLAINRWLRRYTSLMGVRAEIYFLTSSEADTLLFHEQFASFKLPSKTIVGETGIDKITYIALAKQWVWHSLALLRPDLLIVDTFPRGSFGELLSALDLCRHKAFIHRPVKEELATRPDFQSMLPLYDLVVVPEYQEEAQALVSPGAKGPRVQVRYSGPVMVRERFELWSRAEVRKHFAAKEDELLVYVSAGGGGDPNAADDLHRVCQVLLKESGLRIVVGAGPLYRGRALHDDRIVWQTQSGIAEQMAGFDLAVCAAGYNSYHELLHAGVPTIFMPQAKIADEQSRRAERAAGAGAAFCLTESRSGGAEVAWTEQLRDIVLKLRDPVVRNQAAQSALALVPKNHARDAAAELLKLLLPVHEVESAQESLNEKVLGSLRESGLQFEQLVELMHGLSGDAAAPASSKQAAVERSEKSLELLQFSKRNGIPTATLLRSVRLLVPKLGRGSSSEKVEALQSIFKALLPFADWSSAMTLMKLLLGERRLSAAVVGTAVEKFLLHLHARGETLHRAITYLSAAAGADQSLTGNVELLDAATRLCA